jgi:hypothetical protein
MPQVRLNVRANDEASLMIALHSRGLLTASNGWVGVPGVNIYSQGKASIGGPADTKGDPTRIEQAGYFALIVIDTDRLADGQTVADELKTMEWAGEPIIYMMPALPLEVTTLADRAAAWAEAKKQAGGFRTPGAPINWYPFTVGRKKRPLEWLLIRLSRLADDAAVAAESIEIPRLNRVKESLTTRAQVVKILDALELADMRWDRRIDALVDAVEADPAYDWNTHTFPAGYTA